MSMERSRNPAAVANWKMAMTIGESLAFAENFVPLVEAHSRSVEIVICPPYTALQALSQALDRTRIQVGAQDVCASSETSHTGGVSPALVADCGCRWVMLGHWEVRRRRGETDVHVNQKLTAVRPWGLRPILLLGEGSRERDRAQNALALRLPRLFQSCPPEQVASAVLIYEPEWALGQEEPAPVRHIASSCEFLRQWIGEVYGTDTAQSVRILYGGSVTPSCSKDILASPHVDGLGAGRKGRDSEAFAEIVASIALAKHLPT
jgi:triosephosphate isomerase